MYQYFFLHHGLVRKALIVIFYWFFFSAQPTVKTSLTGSLLGPSVIEILTRYMRTQEVDIDSYRAVCMENTTPFHYAINVNENPDDRWMDVL